ncbi:UDP-N-acetylglucosamine pyrophosphorylase [Clostridium taeniosporum]|uniref:UDP-N-acetylglucosamine pyrophosphorylase n=1 Tax=Clostridium taeniosporum TaxID=394958 RepID=A0A1D7XL20_9CLOT|nr:UDP-N-acetylglucosamine pyrophosphorylase [Clostridium taeniosporum]AOR24038.1 UDP-N-acetylglucosamine pyrophosphorylase [Clostridium taeniosporum]
MKLELTIFQLGQILKKLETKYELNLLVKSNLSGGWMTFTGNAIIEKVPALTLGCNNKGNNIIDIKIKNSKDNDDKGNIIKIIGAKGRKFNVDISPTKYIELSCKNKIDENEIKVSEKECKLRIDENIIFTIKDSMDEIIDIIK